MAKMTAEQWVERLRTVAGDNLRSVVLFGSAAVDDQAGTLSDTNLLVVVRSLGVEELALLSEASAAWLRQGEAPPVFITEEELKASADVFPIEFTDLEDARRVLLGEDPMRGLAFSKDNLRVELEHEFRGAVLRLRRTLVATGMDKKRVGEVMLKSASTFLVLLRSVARLLGEAPPLKKGEVLTMIKRRLDFDDEVLRLLEDARHRPADPREVAPYLDRYLAVLDALTVWVDRAGR
jgi:predicted nucleotidyltransferase